MHNTYIPIHAYSLSKQGISSNPHQVLTPMALGHKTNIIIIPHHNFQRYYLTPYENGEIINPQHWPTTSSSSPFSLLVSCRVSNFVSERGTPIGTPFVDLLWKQRKWKRTWFMHIKAQNDIDIFCYKWRIKEVCWAKNDICCCAPINMHEACILIVINLWNINFTTLEWYLKGNATFKTTRLD